ncbi:hypothetical protein L1987_72442 [Smallanthus sonchifolius]|uniref:Uncharacterized protein n=1 Tax=Smallanthus sonchifolius TaxID=185202 RepID=A0ACB9AV82_9ASTR|nr:hypothetical protein L1987_72442 [Smallanthus sonchifolius]
MGIALVLWTLGALHTGPTHINLFDQRLFQCYVTPIHNHLFYKFSVKLNERTEICRPCDLQRQTNQTSYKILIFSLCFFTFLHRIGSFQKFLKKLGPSS